MASHYSGEVAHPESPAAMKCDVASIRLRRILTFADVAQLAEQLICNQQVNGSSPFIGF